MTNAKGQITNSSQILTTKETAMLKKIKATYDLDNLDFNMPPILELIEDVIHTSNVSSDSAEERPMFQYEVIGKMHQNLASKINVISCELLGSCNRYQDANETVLSIFSALSTFSWIAKGVVALAAFAINYGEFRLVVKQCSTDSTAKLLAFLENVPENFLGKDLDNKIAKLAKAAMDLIKYLWRVKYLYAKHINSKAPIVDLNAKHHIAIYWIIQSIVICQSIITNLASTGYECMSSVAEQWELDYLKEKVTEFYQEIESESSEKLWSLFPQEDITVLTHLICSEDHMPMPLIDGVTKIPQKIDMLKNKLVLLYISTLDPHDDEIETLKRVHSALQNEFQFVWLPVLDKSKDWNDDTFEKKRSLMQWLVVRKPQLLDGTIVKFIENGWQFKKRSMIVAFDKDGKVVNKNALPMILIWGRSAFPFTSDKEAMLWKSQTWSLELLLHLPESMVDSNDREKINQWMKDEKNYICLYGGEDIEWIKIFKGKVEAIANNLNIPSVNMHMLNIDSLSFAWIIWARIEAMFLSRSKPGIISCNNEQSSDPIIEGALTMCSFHCSRRGWAIISKGSSKMAKALGNIMLNCLNKCNTEEWKKNGFVESLNACILKNCETLHYLPTFPELPKKKFCSRSHCGRPMRKSVTFHCWGDHKPESTNPTTKS